MTETSREPDDADKEIIARRTARTKARINKNTRPRTGDWAESQGGVCRGVSCIWPGGSIQTADDGFVVPRERLRKLLRRSLRERPWRNPYVR
jgi:hypothetical protein